MNRNKWNERAKKRAKNPNFVKGGEWGECGRNRANNNVGTGEGQNEQIGDGLKGFGAADGQKYTKIAANTDNDNEGIKKGKNGGHKGTSSGITAKGPKKAIHVNARRHREIGGHRNGRRGRKWKEGGGGGGDCQCQFRGNSARWNWGNVDGGIVHINWMDEYLKMGNIIMVHLLILPKFIHLRINL